MERSKKRNVRRKAVDPLEVRARTAGAIDGALKAVVITLGCGKQLHQLVKDNDFITADNVEQFFALTINNLIDAYRDELAFLGRRQKNDVLRAQFIELIPYSTLRTQNLNKTLCALQVIKNKKGILTHTSLKKDLLPEMSLRLFFNLENEKYKFLKEKLTQATRQNGEEDDKPQ